MPSWAVEAVCLLGMDVRSMDFLLVVLMFVFEGMLDVLYSYMRLY